MQKCRNSEFLKLFIKEIICLIQCTRKPFADKTTYYDVHQILIMWFLHKKVVDERDECCLEGLKTPPPPHCGSAPDSDYVFRIVQVPSALEFHRIDHDTLRYKIYYSD